MNQICVTAAAAAETLEYLQCHLDGPLAITERTQREGGCQSPDLWLAVS